MITEYRHELKYLLTNQQLLEIQCALDILMKHDPNIRPDGAYSISSVYFDDYYHTCLCDNQEGNTPREKFRIRVYNHSLKRITLEKKYKVNQMTAKRSCIISEDEMWKAIYGIPLDVEHTSDRALLQEFALDQRTKLLKPIVVVDYDRIPYVSPDGNTRVTLDQSIGGTDDFSDPACLKTIPTCVLPTGYQLLEVKYDDFLPDELYNVLNLGHLQNCAFSKFFLCCQAMKGEFYYEYLH